jgi:hypothetical protein
MSRGFFSKYEDDVHQQSTGDEQAGHACRDNLEYAKIESTVTSTKRIRQTTMSMRGKLRFTSRALFSKHLRIRPVFASDSMCLREIETYK